MSLRVEYRRLAFDGVPVQVVDALAGVGGEPSPISAVVAALREVDTLSAFITSTLGAAQPWSEGGPNGAPLTSFGRVGVGRPDAEVLCPPGPLCDPHRHSVLTRDELQTRCERHFYSRSLSAVASVRGALSAAEDTLTSYEDEAILDMLYRVVQELDLGRHDAPLGYATPVLRVEKHEVPREPAMRRPERRVVREVSPEPAAVPESLPRLK